MGGGGSPGQQDQPTIQQGGPQEGQDGGELSQVRPDLFPDFLCGGPGGGLFSFMQRRLQAALPAHSSSSAGSQRRWALC